MSKHAAIAKQNKQSNVFTTAGVDYSNHNRTGANDENDTGNKHNNNSMLAETDVDDQSQKGNVEEAASEYPHHRLAGYEANN